MIPSLTILIGLLLWGLAAFLAASRPRYDRVAQVMGERIKIVAELLAARMFAAIHTVNTQGYLLPPGVAKGHLPPGVFKGNWPRESRALLQRLLRIRHEPITARDVRFVANLPTSGHPCLKAADWILRATPVRGHKDDQVAIGVVWPYQGTFQILFDRRVHCGGLGWYSVFAPRPLDPTLGTGDFVAVTVHAGNVGLPTVRVIEAYQPTLAQMKAAL